MSAEIPIDMMVRSAERELRYRKNIYPAKVSDGVMTEAEAAHELACQEAILQTLKTEAAQMRLPFE